MTYASSFSALVTCPKLKPFHQEGFHGGNAKGDDYDDTFVPLWI